LLLSLAAALIAGLAIGAWFLPQAFRMPARRLPDGSVLTLEAVTYGKEHRLIEGEWWQKLFAPVLPARLRPHPNRWTDLYVADHPNTLVLWTHQQKMTPASHWDQERWETRVVVSDEHGCRSETGFLGHGAGLNWPPTEAYGAWALPAFPRRGRTLGVQIEERPKAGAWTPVARFTLANPDPGPHPQWTPQSLPVTRQVEDLSITLSGLETGVAPPGDAAGEDWTRARFRIAERGRPTTHWQPTRITLSDAAGDQWTPRAQSNRPEGPEQQLFFRSVLWPAETAWKLRVKLERSAGFTPSDLWPVADVEVPPARRVNRLDRAMTRHGVTLRLLGVAGPRAAIPQGYGWDADHPIVHARLSPDGAGDLGLIAVTDESGRAVPVAHTGYGGAGKYGFTLSPEPNARRLRLTFVVQKPREVEFLVSPSRAR
jgi:hypothetical protein